jgi:hypothetical protein
VLSGGNVDPLLLTKLIEHGLSAAGRYLTLRVVMADRVGALAALTGELARLGLNVLDVEHHRSGRLARGRGGRGPSDRRDPGLGPSLRDRRGPDGRRLSGRSLD